MTVLQFKKTFRELSRFVPFIADDAAKQQRFLDRLNESITLNILGAASTSCHSMRDAALEVERLTISKSPGAEPL